MMERTTETPMIAALGVVGEKYKQDGKFCNTISSKIRL
jgi:hypothetical protein